MTLDEELLREAIAHRSAQLERQHEADRAKADFHHAIRRLHAAGGSLREIADALGVSHQWVHQIVGDEPPPKPKQLGGDLECDFCGASQRDVTKLIAGPGVYICGRCSELASAVIDGSTPSSPRMSRGVVEGSAFKCQFCGKRASKVKVMVQARSARICNECVDLCIDILAEKDVRDRPPKPE